MQNNIPKYLFRGDSDLNNYRNLRATINSHKLLTPLVNGGNGREIKEVPLLQLINRHVKEGWSKTHFLSFTSSEKTSVRFGLSCKNDEVDEKMNSYSEYYNSGTDWDFAIVKINTGKIKWEMIDKGMFEGIYKSFQKFDKCKIILMDVVKILINYNEYRNARADADKDKEWLILPFNALQSQVVEEYSGIFYIDTISGVQKFKKNHEQSIFLEL